MAADGYSGHPRLTPRLKNSSVSVLLHEWVLCFTFLIAMIERPDKINLRGKVYFASRFEGITHHGRKRPEVGGHMTSSQETERWMLALSLLSPPPSVQNPL